MSGETPLVSIIVPVYNEEELVEEVLQRLGKLREKLNAEIIVIDDGSTDNSVQKIREFSWAKLICHKKNLGKGKAIATGVTCSKGQIIIIQDADMEYPPEDIPKIIKPIIEGRADVVYGSRFLGRNEGMSFSHRLGNKILSLAASLLYRIKITDIMTGHKAFLRNFITPSDFKECGFGIEIEVTAKLLRQKLRFLEIPISYSYRRKGCSKISYKDGIKCLLKIFISRFTY